jgi:hypothetical protein
LIFTHAGGTSRCAIRVTLLSGAVTAWLAYSLAGLDPSTVETTTLLSGKHVTQRRRAPDRGSRRGTAGAHLGPRLSEGRPEMDPPQPPHIAVWRSVRRGGDTKTRKSRRPLALPACCVEALWQQSQDQGWDRLSADDAGEEHGLVFSSAAGKPLDAANVRRAFRQAL